MSFQFRLPNVPYDQKLYICLSIMEKQNHELVPLRKKAKGYEIQIDELKQQLEEWKKKYKKSQDELRQTKIEKNKLKQENQEPCGKTAGYEHLPHS